MTIDWKVHPDGYYLAFSPTDGQRYEVGEWSNGTWLLNICGYKTIQCEDLQMAFDIVKQREEYEDV